MGARVVVVGGGFAGLNVAKGLRNTPAEVYLVDRRNFHLFQPLLYQVATGGLSAASVCTPLRAIFKGAENVKVWMADARGIDPRERKLIFHDGVLSYDFLVVATGAKPSYYGQDRWSEYASALKTVEDAARIRAGLLAAFESAERANDPQRVRALLTFVIVGGGPTGVELAGALSEIARYTLRHEFRRIEPSLAKVYLVEMAPRVLPGFSEDLSRKAQRGLEKLGVEVLTGTRVLDVGPGKVVVQRGVLTETIPCENVLWAAGVVVSDFVGQVAAATGAETDRLGRVRVGPDLTVPGFPEIFVVGDAAWASDGRGQPLPGVAPVAIQQGRYVARAILDRLAGRKPRPFRYRDWGSLATVGRHQAVGRIFGLNVWGWLAWFLWAGVHLAKLVSFANRLLVFLQWVWAYLTFGRAARLIVDVPRFVDSSGTYELS